MANTILLKRSATQSKVPTTGQLELGEIAINTYDGKLFIKKNDGTASIVEIGAVTSVNSATGAVVLDTDDISEGSSNAYFTNARARSALSAGTGVTFNTSTGAISIGQSVATSASPTFAGLTLTGNFGITGDIVPSADNTYSLGSSNYMWRDVYVGPGSLYVNGQKVLEDNSGTITVSADQDQSLQVKTTGSGNVQLTTGASGVIQVGATLQIGSGYNITDSAGIEVNFGDTIDMNGNKIVGLGAPSAANDATTKTYVDTAISNISTNSIEQGNSNVTVTDSGSGTVTVSVDGSTALTVNASGVTVAGNLTVSGATTTVESNTVSVADNILTLNSDATGSPTQNAGIEVERGDEANVSVRWNEGSDVWQITNDGATYTQIATSTDTLSEGSSNLYHTTARARTAISASGSISYNSTTGVISYTTPTTIASLSNHDTDDLAEGSNLYYTDSRARNAISVTGDLSYSSSTGVISFTKPSPVITLAGDLSGSVTLSSLGSGTLTATIAANSVALGTDTTGNYMVNVSAGTGISVSHTQGEGSTATITNTGVTSLNGDTGAKTLAHFHSSVQTTTSAQETSNASSTVSFTFSELSGAVHYVVFINRTMLRASEYTVSGTTLSFASGFGLQEGDEIEVTGARFTA